MLLSDDMELLTRARYLSTQARQPVPWYEHVDIGYNYRLSNLRAALGRAQLVRLDQMIARRREINARYREGLDDIEGLRFLGVAGDDGNAWLTSAVIDPAVARCSGPDLVPLLNAHGIEARHLWKPMHLQPVFAGNRSLLTGSAQRLFEQGINLPSGSVLTDDQVDQVIDALRAELVA